MRIRPLFIVFLAAAVMFGACGGNDTGSFRLTFDGESCVHDGPTDFKAGQVEFTFINDGDTVGYVGLVRITGDQTEQDLIDHLGPEPSTAEPPFWVQDVVRQPVSPGGTYEWAGNFQAGAYDSACIRFEPSVGVWHGAWLTVEE